MRAAFALAALLFIPGTAAADWITTPFFGTTFGVTTNVVVGDPAVGAKKFVFGGSFALLTDGILGLEATASHIPHFFEGASDSLVLASGVSTLTGNVILAVPQAITGYSLRPYVSGGVGLLHASSRDATALLILDSNLLGLTIGGGAIGMLSNATGMRFELRHTRNVTFDDSAVTNSGGATRISFWQATVGVVYRF